MSLSAFVSLTFTFFFFTSIYKAEKGVKVNKWDKMSQSKQTVVEKTPRVIGYYASVKREVKTLADQKSVGVDPEQIDFCRNRRLPFVCYQPFAHLSHKL